MSLINEKYLQNEPCNLGVASPSNGYADEAVGSELKALKRAIIRFEPLYLEMLLGEDVYAEYEADSDNAKWQPLVDKLVDSDNFISPIANFVYCMQRMETYISSNGHADTITKGSDNTLVVDPRHKVMIAWNDMVRLNAKVCKWIIDNIITADTPTIELENEIDTTYWTESSTYASALLQTENGLL